MPWLASYFLACWLAARILGPYLYSSGPAGHPIATANAAKTVHPTPYPRRSNMAGANRGNPKPASERVAAEAA